MTRTEPPRAGDRARRGFSLIEVTIALGLAAVGITVLLALIPHSLSGFRQAGDLAMEARIAHHLLGEINLTNWDQIEQFNGTRRFFDKEGVELESGDSAAPDALEDLIYTAHIGILDPEGRIPGATHPPMRKARTLRRAIIRVTDVPLPGFNFDAEDRRGQFRTYPGVVTKMSK